MEFTDAKTLLETHGQGHVLAFWDTLSADERTALLEQIATLDFASIERMQGMLNDAGTPAASASAFEWEVLRLVNIERAREGLEALTLLPALQELCDIRAREITQKFSHTG